jgi:hypothetical protein
MLSLLSAHPQHLSHTGFGCDKDNEVVYNNNF